MGTYRQPSQIIDKSLNTLNQGLQNVQQTMTAELNRRREIELKKAEAAEKKSEAFQSSRDSKVDEYKYAMSDWKTINQGKDPNWESEDVSVENQLKNNALYYLDIMSSSVEGDERYRNAELSIKNMIRDYPVMAELLNSEAQEWNKTRENPDSLIETDDPLAKTKQGMLGDIYDGKNPYRFNVQAGPQGLSIKYRGEDGSDFNLRAQDYEKHVSNGYNLIETTNNDTYNEFMEGVSGVVFQNYNDNVTEQQISTFKDDLKTGKRTTTTEVIENFERANASVKKQIYAYVDKGAPITQNEWQLLGGTGVYRGTDDQKVILKDKLYEQQLAMNGVPDSDLNILRKRSTKESGLSSEVINGAEVEVVSYDTIINDAKALKKSLDNPNIDPKTGERITEQQIKDGLFERLSNEEKDNKQKLTDDLKKRFGGSGFSTGSGIKVIQDIEIKYKDGELLLFPQVDYSTTKNKDDIKTLKEYSLGVPITNERLLKFEKQLKQIAKDSVVSSGTSSKPPAY